MSNKLLLSMVLILLIASILSIFSVFVLVQPAVIEGFNLIGKGDIGSVIGGITSPIIGIISIILLIQTLSKQQEANSEQRFRNEVDIILSLFNHLESELGTFYYKYKQGKEEYKFTGIEGLNTFILDTVYAPGSNWYNLDGVKFGESFESKQISLLFTSYNLVKARIKSSSVPFNTRILLEKKLISFYEARLRYAAMGLNKLFSANPSLTNSYTIEMDRFFTENEKEFERLAISVQV